MAKSESLMICQVDGTLRESTGFSEYLFLLGSFFTYLFLSSLLSLNSKSPLFQMKASENNG